MATNASLPEAQAALCTECVRACKEVVEHVTRAPGGNADAKPRTIVTRAKEGADAATRLVTALSSVESRGSRHSAAATIARSLYLQSKSLLRACCAHLYPDTPPITQDQCDDLRLRLRNLAKIVRALLAAMPPLPATESRRDGSDTGDASGVGGSVGGGCNDDDDDDADVDVDNNVSSASSSRLKGKRPSFVVVPVVQGGGDREEDDEEEEEIEWQEPQVPLDPLCRRAVLAVQRIAHITKQVTSDSGKAVTEPTFVAAAKECLGSLGRVMAWARDARLDDLDDRLRDVTRHLVFTCKQAYRASHPIGAPARDPLVDSGSSAAPTAADVAAAADAVAIALRDLMRLTARRRKRPTGQHRSQRVSQLVASSTSLTGSRALGLSSFSTRVRASCAAARRRHNTLLQMSRQSVSLDTDEASQTLQASAASMHTTSLTKKLTGKTLANRIRQSQACIMSLSYANSSKAPQTDSESNSAGGSTSSGSTSSAPSTPTMRTRFVVGKHRMQRNARSPSLSGLGDETTILDLADLIGAQALTEEAAATIIQSHIRRFLAVKMVHSTVEAKAKEDATMLSKMRGLCLEELIESEISFYSDMKLLQDRFVKPMIHLKLGITQHGDFVLMKEYLESVYLVTRDLLKGLRRRLEQWDEKDPLTHTMADIYLKHMSRLRCYVYYSQIVVSVHELFNQNRFRETELDQFLASVEVAEDVTYFFMLPLQHMTSYVKLLDRLLHWTPVLHVDHMNVARALEQMTVLHTLGLEHRQNEENRKRLTEVEAVVAAKQPLNLLNDPERILIREGPVDVMSKSSSFTSSSSSSRWKRRKKRGGYYVFMLSDRCLLTKRNRSKKRGFKLVDVILFKKLVVNNVVDTGDTFNAFDVILGDRSDSGSGRGSRSAKGSGKMGPKQYRFSVLSNQEKLSWLQDFQAAITATNAPHDSQF